MIYFATSNLRRCILKKQNSSKGYKKKAILFLASQSITLFGSSLTQFALIWYVTMLTSSGIWLSVMTIAAYLPQFLISFFSGVWAYRYSRKKFSICSRI